MRSVLIVVLVLLSAATDALAGGLRILLTNDDGWDAAGVTAVAEALKAGGHEVTVVAPLTQQSGTGMKVTVGELAVLEQAPGVWSVDGSPVDAVGVALERVMVDEPPELVVSGANFGQNLGNNVMISGTVGAAMAAAMRGVPAIAISVGLDLAEATSEPRFVSTIAAFPGAARFAARLVDALAAAADERLLPRGRVLNVNYPALPGGAAPQGIEWTATSAHGGFSMRYLATPDGGTRSTFVHDTAGHSETMTDTGRFAAGYVTLSMLAPNWNITDGKPPAAWQRRMSDGALLEP